MFLAQLPQQHLNLTPRKGGQNLAEFFHLRASQCVVRDMFQQKRLVGPATQAFLARVMLLHIPRSTRFE